MTRWLHQDDITSVCQDKAARSICSLVTTRLLKGCDPLSGLLRCIWASSSSLMDLKWHQPRMQPQHTCENLLDDGGTSSCSAALIKAKDIMRFSFYLNIHLTIKIKSTQASIPSELCSAVVQIALRFLYNLTLAGRITSNWHKPTAEEYPV